MSPGSGQGEPIEDFFVEFSAKGLGALLESVEDLHTRLGTLAAAALKTAATIATVPQLPAQALPAPAQTAAASGPPAPGAAPTAAAPAPTGTFTPSLLQVLTHAVHALADNVAHLAGTSLQQLKGEFQGLVNAVTLTSAGVARLGQAFRSVMGDAASMMGGLGRLKGTLDNLGSASGHVFGLLMGSVGGFALVGFHASAAGELFGLRMQELSRQVASLFLPQIEKLLSWVEKLVLWFRNLSGAQQDTIGKWLTGAAVLTGTLMILPRLVAGFGAVIKMVTGLGAALRMLAMNPLLLLAAGIAAVVVNTTEMRDLIEGATVLADGLKDAFSAIRDLAKSIADYLSDAFKEMQKMSLFRPGGRDENKDESEAPFDLGAHLLNTLLPGRVGDLLKAEGEEKKKGLGINPPEPEKKKPHHELMPRLGGFSSLDEAYKRIAEKTVKATSGVKSPEEETAQNTGTLVGLISAILLVVRNAKPGII